MPYKSVKAKDLFLCQQCGDCCEGYGGTYLTDQEVLAISAYIQVEEKEFIKKYCDMSGNRPILAQGSNGYCIFFDKLCTIHSVKPRMCKAWPFIQPVLVDVNNWHIMGGVCPGIRTDFPDEVIKKVCRDVLEQIYPNPFNATGRHPTP